MNKQLFNKIKRREGNSSLLYFLPLLTFFCAIFASCGNARKLPENAVPFFNEFAFQLNHKETVISTDSTVFSIYEDHWKEKPISVPLFRTISGEPFHIFLGIPFNTNLKQAIQMQALTENKPGYLIDTDSTNYLYTYQKLDSTVTAEYYHYSNNTFLYSLIKGTDHQLEKDTLFSKEALAKRFLNLSE